MGLEAVVKARLVSQVTAVESRVYGLRAKQNAELPHLVFFRAARSKFPAMGSDPSLQEVLVQVNVWAGDYTQVLSVADAVKAALERWRTTSGTPLIQDVLAGDLDDDIDPLADADEVRPELFCRAMDFRVFAA